MELFKELLVNSYEGDYSHIRQVIVSFLMKNTSADIRVEGDRKGKENVIAFWGDQPEFVINCHMDTVQPQGNWKYPPCDLTLNGDKAYGLGTTDTKGNIYSVLKAVLKHEPVNGILLFSVDEESGGVESGVSWFLNSRFSKNIKKAIVCEPTDLKFVYKHPGYCSFDLIFQGDTGHSSGSVDTDPIENAAKVALALKSQGFHLGMIKGGKRGNAAAAGALLRVSKRSYSSPSDIKESVKALSSGIPKVTVQPRMLGPAFNNPQGLSNELKGEKEVGFWTEAALFHERNIPALVFGGGSIKQAHHTDEFVVLDQLKGCQEKFEQILAGGF